MQVVEAFKGTCESSSHVGPTGAALRMPHTSYIRAAHKEGESTSQKLGRANGLATTKELESQAEPYQRIRTNDLDVMGDQRSGTGRRQIS